jgi:hypothetical protein
MFGFVLLIVTLLFSARAVTWETDQYTLSPEPLAETGEEVSRYIYDKLQVSLDLARHCKNLPQ